MSCVFEDATLGGTAPYGRRMNTEQCPECGAVGEPKHPVVNGVLLYDRVIERTCPNEAEHQQAVQRRIPVYLFRPGKDGGGN